jgi:hypothetical protein
MLVTNVSRLVYYAGFYVLTCTIHQPPDPKSTALTTTLRFSSLLIHFDTLIFYFLLLLYIYIFYFFFLSHYHFLFLF